MRHSKKMAKTLCIFSQLRNLFFLFTALTFVSCSQDQPNDDIHFGPCPSDKTYDKPAQLN